MSVLNIIKKIFLNDSHAHHHGSGHKSVKSGLRKIIIVGTPNVGKSVIFNRLTGAYVTVSNYPGTTVSITSGSTFLSGEEFEVMDTPGMYSMMPITEEERVARTILIHSKPDIVLHVIDGRNLERMLPMTLQLIEANLPVALVLNMMDEAESAGILIDVGALEHRLSIPVIATVATSGRGIDSLKKRLAEYAART